MKKTAYYFDSISEEFESWINRFDLNTRLKWFALQLDQFDIRKKKVLDVGCGLGYFSRLALERGGYPVPLDISVKLLDRIRNEMPACVQGDALRLPFEDNSFPFVISSECIEHTLNPQGAIEEMIRVLAPGGVIVLSTPNFVWRYSIPVAEWLGIRKFKGIENWMTRRQVSRVFTKAGFKILVNEGLYLFPFQIKILRPLISWFNQHGQVLRGLMINQCWVAQEIRNSQK